MDKTIYNLPDILQETVASFDAIRTFIKTCPDTSFDLIQQKDKWTIKEEFEHLILSNKAVSSALKLPKLVLRGFGKPRNPSRSFEALVNRYHEKLGDGVGPAVTGKFTPKKSNPITKEDMLSGWEMIAQKYEDRMQSWTEEKLDKYLLPHPLLGKLTVREMLFFTVYHNQHHLDGMNAKLAVV